MLCVHQVANDVLFGSPARRNRRRYSQLDTSIALDVRLLVRGSCVSAMITVIVYAFSNPSGTDCVIINVIIILIIRYNALSQLEAVRRLLPLPPARHYHTW